MKAIGNTNVPAHTKYPTIYTWAKVDYFSTSFVQYLQENSL